MSDRPSRRRILAGLGAGFMAGIAGCSDSDSAAQTEGTTAETDTDTTTGTDDEAESPENETTDDEEESTAEQSTDDESTDDGDNGGTSGRAISGGVRNDLNGLEVVEHSATVGEDGFTGSLTVRNVGDETASLLDHEIEFELFDAEGEILAGLEGWKGETRELDPGEEGVMEFFDGPATDVDFSLVESYEVVLTCSVASPGVYCP